jgi:fibronectin-binding autotransporter adhesin
VRNGGAVIDTNGFNITIGQILQHSVLGGDSATDGGLTKKGAGALTLSGANTYTGTTTIQAGEVVVAHNTAFGTGAVSLGQAGSASRIQLGNGTSVANALTINAQSGTGGQGVLEINAAGATATWSGPITISGNPGAGGHFYTPATSTLTLSGPISGNFIQRDGNVVYSGGGAYTGATITGTAKVGATNGMSTTAVASLGASAAATLDLNGFNQTLAGITKSASAATVTNNGGGAAVLTLDSATDRTFDGLISGGTGGLSLVKQGSSTLTLNENNTYAGGTTISAGTLQIGNGGTTGSLSSTGTMVNNAAVVFNRSNDLSYSAAITGSGTLTKLGAGVLTLSGASSYTGVTTVSVGTLKINHASALGGTTGSTLVGDAVTGIQPNLRIGTGIHLNGEALTLQSSAAGGRGYLETASGDTGTYTGAITLAGSGTNGLRASGTLTVNGTMGGSSSSLQLRGTGAGTLNSVLSIGATPINKTDAGTWTIGSTGNAWGGTTVAIGTLKAGVANALPTTTVVTMGQNDANNATLDLNGYSQSVAGLVFSSTGGTKTITSTAAATLTVDTASAYSYGGLLTGAGLSVVKQGASTLTLSGGNTYAGGTTINAGTLRLTGTGGAGTGAILVGNGTLSLYRSGATTTFANAVTSTLGTTGTLTVDGSGSNAGTGTNSTYDLGTLTVNGTLTVSRPTGGTGHTVFSDLLTGGGTLVVDNTNGGTAPSTSAIGRAYFTNAGNTFTGAVQILSGGNFMNIGTNPTYASVDIAAGGFLSLVAPNTATVGSLNGAGSITKNTDTGTATLVVGNGNASGAFSGVIAQDLLAATGTVALTKTGTGTQTLSGVNTYGGATTINGGTLLISGTGQLGGGAYGGTITNDATLQYSSSANQTLSGAMGGAGTLVKDTSTSTLTLSGASNFSGGTTVKAGTLAIATNAAAAGTGGIQLGDTTGSAAVTLRIDNSISPTNALTINAGSSGVKTVSTGNVATPGYSGTITMNDHLTVNLNYTSNVNQTFTLGGAGNLDLTSRTLTLTLAPTSTNNPTSTISISKPIVGTGGIVINGSGASTGTRTVNISASNSYSGGTTLSRGTLNWNHNNALGSGTVTLNNVATGANGVTLNRNSNGTLPNNIVVANLGTGTTVIGNGGNASVIYGGSLTLNKNVTLNAGDAVGTTTFSGAISGTGGILKDGPGTVLISNNNSGFSGTVHIGSGTLDRGTLRVSSSNGLGSGTVSIFGQTTGKGMVQLTGGITLSNNIVIANSRSTFNGGGFAHLSNLSGNNTFSGDMTITAGGGSGANIESLAGFLTLSGTLKNDAGTFARPFVFGGAGSGEVTGSIVNGTSYATALVKQGAGTWTISSANTYSGETQVSGGILRLGNNAAAGTSLIRLLGGAVTSVGAAPRTLTNLLTVETDGSTLGDATDSGALTVHGAVSLVGAINTDRLLNIASPVTLTGPVSGTSLRGLNKGGESTLTLTGSGDWTGNTTVSGGTFLVSGGASIPSGGNLTATTGGSFRINTTGAVNAPSTVIQTGSTVSLEAGTLRTNSITAGGTGTFTWTGGTLATYSGATSESGNDVSSAGGARVFLGRQLSFTGSLTTGGNTTLDLGDLYISGPTLFNQIAITGTLAVGENTTLRSLSNAYLLRPSTGGTPTDWGTLVLVDAGGIVDGVNFNFVAPLSDGGRSFAEHTGAWPLSGDPQDLPVDTWYLERTGTQVLFHYHVSAAIPEPGTAGLLMAGGLLLRIAARRRKTPHS